MAFLVARHCIFTEQAPDLYQIYLTYKCACHTNWLFELFMAGPSPPPPTTTTTTTTTPNVTSKGAKFKEEINLKQQSELTNLKTKPKRSQHYHHHSKSLLEYPSVQIFFTLFLQNNGSTARKHSCLSQVTCCKDGKRKNYTVIFRELL